MKQQDKLEIEKFAKVYSNLPLRERDMVVVVIDEQPITWNRAYSEIRGNTKIGKKIFEKLIKLEII